MRAENGRNREDINAIAVSGHYGSDVNLELCSP